MYWGTSLIYWIFVLILDASLIWDTSLTYGILLLCMGYYSYMLDVTLIYMNIYVNIYIYIVYIYIYNMDILVCIYIYIYIYTTLIYGIHPQGSQECGQCQACG